MNYFRLLAHLDTFDVVAHLHKHLLLFDSDGLLLLRDAEGKEPVYRNADRKELLSFAKWKSLQRLLRQARAIVRLTDEWGEILIDRMAAGTATPWQADASTEFHTLIVPLVVNPFVQHYARNEMVHMPAGSLWGLDTLVMGSVANWGEQPSYRLVFQIRKAPPPDAPDL